MSDQKQYKCPCCGGGIEFDSNSQKMKCPYCDTEFDTDTLRGYDEDLNSDGSDDFEWNTDAGKQWDGEESENLNVYVCKSCGGEIIGDDTLAATECPYCGNPVIISGKLRGALKPDLVIPFKLDKEAAKAGLRKHFEGKRLLPRIFKTENRIDEIKGVYVPFWLFDADADVDIRYKGEIVSHWSDSDYDYTKTEYYSIIRQGDIGFDNVPVDGSTKIENDLTESLEPYDLSEAVDFQTAFLSGYIADKYDVDAETSCARANERVRTSTEREFARTVVGYDSYRVEHSAIRLENGRAKYALLPVWLLNTSWKDKKFTFAMNGQTGKFVGNLPMDGKAFARWFFGVAGAVAAAIMGITFLMHLM